MKRVALRRRLRRALGYAGAFPVSAVAAALAAPLILTGALARAAALGADEAAA